LTLTFHGCIVAHDTAMNHSHTRQKTGTCSLFSGVKATQQASDTIIWGRKSNILSLSNRIWHGVDMVLYSEAYTMSRTAIYGITINPFAVCKSLIDVSIIYIGMHTRLNLCG